MWNMALSVVTPRILYIFDICAYVAPNKYHIKSRRLPILLITDLNIPTIIIEKTQVRFNRYASIAAANIQSRSIESLKLT